MTVLIGRAGRDAFDDSALIQQAINDVYTAYGDRVSVASKKKSLHKFGRTLQANDGVKTTVAVFQDAVVNETFATGNTVDKIVSTSASDTGQAIVEGHYFDASGNNLIFSRQTPTLTGQTPADLSPALCRANRIDNPGSAYFQGSLAVFDSTLSGGGVTAGKPDVDAAVKVMCIGNATEDLALNNSEKCATSLDFETYFFISEIYAGMIRNTGGTVNADIDVEYRQLGGVWRKIGSQINLRRDAIDAFHDEMSPFIVVPKNSDVRMVATATAANTQIAGYMHGYFAKVIRSA